MRCNSTSPILERNGFAIGADERIHVQSVVFGAYVSGEADEEAIDVNEENYIRYRKVKACINRLSFYVCRIFPIRKNRISICTFEGRGGFGCNPKYIVEELHRRNRNYEFIWFVNDMKKEFPDYIKKVPNTLWSRAYWLSTSKIWIDNYRKPYGTIKRKKQYYFQTWHGTIGFKSTGLLRKEAFSKMAYLVSKNDSDMIDYVIIDSKWCEVMDPKALVYDGEFLRTGAPRCDVLYGDKKDIRTAFRKKYGLEQTDKIVIFAPTFREKSHGGVRSVYSEKWSIDFERMILNLKKKFGGNWTLCLRMHPQLAKNMMDDFQLTSTIKIIDISDEDDMNVNLAAMDALVTDYSSAAMDASFMRIPVFIYADDLEKYIRDRGSVLWDFSRVSDGIIKNDQEMIPGINTELPYTVAQNNDELEKNILEFEEDRYAKQMDKFVKDVELIFDGKASMRVSNKIEYFME